MLVHWTQHTTSTAPCAADYISKNIHRLVQRPAEGKPDPMLPILGAQRLRVGLILPCLVASRSST
jgi:hypothetical protein